MPELTPTDIAKAVRNEPRGTFTLGDEEFGVTPRTFEIKDLDYDSYIEFVDLARPILSALAESLQVTQDNGELGLQFDPSSLNYEELIKLAGSKLPRMAWLCCKQSDRSIKLDEVKRLGRRPHNLLMVVIEQVKANKLVEEFARAFPQIAASLKELVPAATEAVAPIPMADQTQPTE